MATRVLTYLGRRCEVTTEELPGRKRLVVYRWIDDAGPRNGGHVAGTIVDKVLSGDARNGSLVVHSEIVTPPK